MQSVVDRMKLAFRDPSRVLVGLNRLYHQRFWTLDSNPDGIDIFDEDWDTLVILDACRLDAFRATSDVPGRDDHRISRGSTTKEFIKANFDGKVRYDTVYVSANGWYRHLQDELESELFRFIHADRDAVDGLSSTPETVTDTAIDALEQHPDKRLIVHYLQPHQPYLGERGETIDHEGSLYNTVEKNDLASDVVVEAYLENLRLVLAEVERLLEAIDGRTVITADHGELLGDPQWPIPVRDFGHPGGIYVEDLVKVPWHIREDGRRRIVPADGPYSEETDETASVKQHLSDLGYRT